MNNEPPNAIEETDETPNAEPTIVRIASGRRFWQRFGGDGFLISLGLHAVVGIGALFYVVSYFTPSEEKQPDDFTVGAGGGNNGSNAKMYEQRIKPKNPRNQIKSQNKLAVKGGKASVALPDMPQMQMNALTDGGLAGGGAKGAFTGQVGPGSGGRNMVSMFGMKGFGAGGLVGSFYDLKQFADGTPTEMEPGDGKAKQAYIDKLRDFCRAGFKEGVLVKYFKSPEKLTLSQIYFGEYEKNRWKGLKAEEAPKAYEVQDKVKPSRWLAHYTGKLKAPKSGRFRLVGLGDDILTVYWNGKPVLDAGYDFLSVKMPVSCGTSPKNKPSNGTGDPITSEQAEAWTPGRKAGIKYQMRVGEWINVMKGQQCQVDILIGETPGGVFEAYLALEEAAAGNNKEPGKLVLFKIGAEPVPDGIARGSNRLRCDMSGGEWVWQAVTRTIGR